MSLAAFDSRKNYLKQFMQGTATMDAPNTVDPSSGWYASTYTVTHNLGYRPLVRAWYDPTGDGVIFPVNSQRGELYSLIYVTAAVPFVFFIDDITSTTVVFRAEDNDLNPGTFSFWYKIYLDPTV